MKKIIGLLTIIMLLSVSYSNAQVRFGVKGGLNMTNITDYHVDSKSRTGFHGGGIVMLPLDSYEKVFLQGEVLYLNHGERQVGNGVSEKYFIDYLAVPIMFKIFLSDNESAFFGEVGPQLAFKINQKTVSDFSTPTYSGDRDKVASFDASIGLGIGYSIYREWELGIRYNYGFTDVYPKATGDTTSDKNNVTSAIRFSISYIFR